MTRSLAALPLYLKHLLIPFVLALAVVAHGGEFKGNEPNHFPAELNCIKVEPVNKEKFHPYIDLSEPGGTFENQPASTTSKAARTN